MQNQFKAFQSGSTMQTVIRTGNQEIFNVSDLALNNELGGHMHELYMYI